MSVFTCHSPRRLQPSFLQHHREPPEAAAHALPRVLLGAGQPACDLRVRQLLDHAQPERLALVGAERLHRLLDRAADRPEVDEVLDALVVGGRELSLGHPEAPPRRPVHPARPEEPAQLVPRHSVDPRHPVRSRVSIGRPRREGLRERLGGELGRGFGVERSPGEVPEEVLRMAAVQLGERAGVRRRRREELAIAAPILHSSPTFWLRCGVSPVPCLGCEPM